jgi:hypothetical protein
MRFLIGGRFAFGLNLVGEFMRYIILLAVYLALLPVPSRAAEPVPGEACGAAGASMFSNNAGAGNWLVCESGLWKPVLSHNGAGALTKLGNQTCAAGEILKFNGTVWVCAADNAGSGGVPALTGDVPASGSGAVATTIAGNAVTSAKILDGTVSNADLAGSIALSKLSTTGTPGTTTYLRGDGAWSAVSAAPGGNGYTVQYNNNGALGGIPGLTYNSTSDMVSLSSAAGYPLQLTASATSGAALMVFATASSGSMNGGSFTTNAPTGKAVSGVNQATTGYNNYGGYFETRSDSGNGVYGRAFHPTGYTTGGYFIADSTGGTGVYGMGGVAGGQFSTTGSSATSYGLRAIASSGSSIGAEFVSNGPTGISLSVKAGNAGTRPLVVQGVNGQTANLTEWRSWTGSPIAIISTTGAFSNPSDRRLKKDIAGLELGLDFINRMHPVSYRMKEGADALRYGFIAQDVAEELPGDLREAAVKGEGMALIEKDSSGFYRMSYLELIAPLVKAMQELGAKNEALSRRITALCGELKSAACETSADPR